jgi:lipoate-protein ligase B
MSKAFHADLGKISYIELMAIQDQIIELRKNDNVQDIVLFAEHPPSLLFSRKTTSFSHEGIKAAQAAAKHPFDHAKDSGISVHHTDFSGATYAGPGQLAVHVVSDYTRLFRPHDTQGFNSMLDDIIMQTIESFGIKPELRKHVMADVDGAPHKIAQRAAKMGKKVAAGSMHFHVSLDSTKHFGMISGSENITSAEEVLGYAPSREEVKSAILDAVEKHMKYDKIEECAISRSEEGISIKKI